MDNNEIITAIDAGKIAKDNFEESCKKIYSYIMQTIRIYSEKGFSECIVPVEADKYMVCTLKKMLFNEKFKVNVTSNLYTLNVIFHIYW